MDEFTNLEQQASYIVSDIISAEDIKQAETDRKQSSAAQWRRERLSLKLQEMIGDELEVTAIRMAVGYLYDVGPETVRRGEAAAEWVSVETVDAHPELTFSYWRTACDASHLETKEESIADIIQQIYEHIEEYGKRPSVATVQGWMSGRPGVLPWRVRLEGVPGTLDKIIHDKYAAEDGKAVASLCKTWILNYLETGRSLIVPPGPEGRKV